MGTDSVRAFLAAAAFYLYNSLISHIPSYALRHFYLARVLGIRLGRGASVHMGCFITGKRIEIGERAVINRKCTLDGRVGVRIGADASISPEVCILSLSHDPQDPGFATKGGEVVIGPRAWLGTRAMVLPGAVIGEGAIIAAGAVATRSCEPFAIMAGVPARKIGERNRQLGYSLKYLPWFNTDILPP
jgi:acetyltransferase-like isoleucine patch superfamily enzyme